VLFAFNVHKIVVGYATL